MPRLPPLGIGGGLAVSEATINQLQAYLVIGEALLVADGATTIAWDMDDFGMSGGSTWYTTSSGSGSYAAQEEASGGIETIATSDSDAAATRTRYRNGFVGVANAVSWYCAARVKMTGGTVASGVRVGFGFGSSGAGGDDDMMIGIFGAVSTTKFSIYKRANGTINTTGAALAADIDSSWHVMEMWRLNGGATLFARLDGGSSESMNTTGIPSNGDGYPQRHVSSGGAAAQNRELKCDWIITMTTRGSP